MKKTLLLFVLAILATVMVACGGDNSEEENAGNEGNEETAEEGNSEDGNNEDSSSDNENNNNEDSNNEDSNNEGSDQSGESVSEVAEDDVVATVNGEDILGAQLLQAEQAVSQQYQMMGMDPSNNAGAIRESAINQVVNTKVIELAAKEDGLEPSDEEVQEEVDTQLSNIQEQQELESKDAVLEQLDMSQEEVNRQIRQSLLVNNYMDENLEEPSVSDEEIQQAYDDYVSRMEEMEQEADDLENMRSDLESQVKQQKQREQQQELIDNLRADAEVNVQI
ncbi:peptidyl-prolyl cis-trans isomerase SurA [Alkalibacillus flavidus]|uniref:Peptidyl-prolyl cis-trans isomerase SurA n=1 Tax=Alkalibacillus flavidus TaxID=546021 RepID=A0ABV2KZA1_9BACI